ATRERPDTNFFMSLRRARAAFVFARRGDGKRCKPYRRWGERSHRLAAGRGAMARRVEGKAAIVVGGGQTPGQTIGNGRATAVLLAREGARVCVVDRDRASARATVDMIEGEGGQAWAFEADITNEDAAARLMAAALERFGRLDILHNNVGASLALGDAPATELTEAAFQKSFDVNLKGMWLACKHALPALRQAGGSIVNISSMAALNAYPLVGYKTMKAAVVALTENLAAQNATHGVRANAILPGLMN